MNVHVCEREIQSIDKRGSSLGDGITYDFYSFILLYIIDIINSFEFQYNKIFKEFYTLYFPL